MTEFEGILSLENHGNTKIGKPIYYWKVGDTSFNTFDVSPMLMLARNKNVKIDLTIKVVGDKTYYNYKNGKIQVLGEAVTNVEIQNKQPVSTEELKNKMIEYLRAAADVSDEVEPEIKLTNEHVKDIAVTFFINYYQNLRWKK